MNGPQDRLVDLTSPARVLRYNVVLTVGAGQQRANRLEHYEQDI